MFLVNRLGASFLRWGGNVESQLRLETDTFLRVRIRAGPFRIALHSRLRVVNNAEKFYHRDRTARPTFKMSHDRGWRGSCCSEHET